MTEINKKQTPYKSESQPDTQIKPLKQTHDTCGCTILKPPVKPKKEQK